MVRVGQTAPDFTLPDLSGRAMALHSYLGRKVVIFTWATW